MKRRVRIRPKAQQDIEQAMLWYEQQREGLGGEFLADLRITFDKVAAFPEAFITEYRTARRAILDRFPYKVYFVLGQDKVVMVIAVLHARQRTSRLRGRFE